MRREIVVNARKPRRMRRKKRKKKRIEGKKNVYTQKICMFTCVCTRKEVG